MKKIVLAVSLLCGIVFCAHAATESADQLRVREFAVMGYQGLSYELHSSEGPYLKTLVDLLGVPEEKRGDTIERVRKILKENPNIMDFADQVSSLRTERIAPTAAAVAEPVPTGPTVFSGDRLDPALSHLSKGMKVTVMLKGGSRYEGQFEDYSVRRLWIKGAPRKSFSLDEILAIDAPALR